MKLKEILRLPKTNLKISDWASGHVPRSKFPMSRLKTKSYRFGSDWQWRVVTFDAASFSCRILILFNESKEIYRARFGVQQGDDMQVLCEHEYHAVEPGWHCHLTLKDTSIAPIGAARHGKTKWPKISSRMEFGVSKANAISIAAQMFRFEAQGTLL